jgi:hypothetical protein
MRSFMLLGVLTLVAILVALLIALLVEVLVEASVEAFVVSLVEIGGSTSVAMDLKTQPCRDNCRIASALEGEKH